MIKKEFELTQSSLKDFINLDRKDWHKKWILQQRPYERNESFIYGSLLDGFLFEPEVLPKRFITYRGKDKVTEAQQGVIGLAVTKLKYLSLNDAILHAAKELNYGQSWKPETLLKRFDSCRDYIEFNKIHWNKIILYPIYVREVQKVAEYLVNMQGGDLGNFIVAEPSEDYRNDFQVTIRSEIDGVKCKAILDILHWDEINSTVRIVDFKTTYSVEKFIDSVQKYGYDTQLSFYQDLLRRNSHLYKGYTLLDPLNIVVAKSNLDTYIHNFYDYEMKLCKYGDPQMNRKGWLGVVEEVGKYLKSIK